MNIGKKTIKMMKIEQLRFNVNINNVNAFTTLRGIKYPSNSYSEFNICNYTGDTKEHILKCRFELCKELGIADDHLIMPRQTHTSTVALIDQAFMQLQHQERAKALQDVDALVSCLHGVAIGVNTADCVPIAFCDPQNGIVAIAHAGWKGTISKIGANTISTMLSIGAVLQNIHVAIGASICQDCFEVGDEVVAQFRDANFPIDEIMYRNQATQKAHINLQLANAITLWQAGIMPQNISFSDNCTKCNPAKYYSARTLGIASGRTFTAIIME
ncbi:MAG: peptidoglycan editing factor PgeF [Muribaculaceae bacterium]